MRDPIEEDWSKLYDQEFSPDEIADALVFADIFSSYNLTVDFVKTFVAEDLKVGHRLFLAMNLEPDVLGVICMREDDDRIMRVAKARCGEEIIESDGRSAILMPWEMNR